MLLLLPIEVGEVEDDSRLEGQNLPQATHLKENAHQMSYFVEVELG